MKETDLIKEKLATLTREEIVEEIIRIDRGLEVAASESARKRYLTRRELYQAALASLGTYTDPEEPLHILTLHQPWASHMRNGDKQVETRSRHWKRLNWVAIHAAASSPNCRDTALPKGCILAVVRVYVSMPTEAANVSLKERVLGNYAPGRFAYFTTNRGVLPRPIPWKGGQGLRIAPLALRCEIAAQLFETRPSQTP